MLYTLRDLVDFAWENKKKHGFKGFNYEDIASEIHQAVLKNKLHYVADECGICGLAIATPYYASKRLYIHHIVATRSGLWTLLHYAKNKFPGFSLEGKRGKKIVTFNQRLLWATVLQVVNKRQEMRCAI